MSRLNCWEVSRCGRQPEGTASRRDGICPAATDLEFDGANGGRAAGRFCWMIAGTFCRGRPQGSLVEKHHDCILCPFMEQVAREEGGRFLIDRDGFLERRLDRLLRRDP